MGVNLTQAEFERVVEEALASLPARFAKAIANVVISVEEEPTDEDLASIAECEDADDDPADGERDGEGEELLGIYRGVPLTERTHDDPLLPDEVAIFRGPINRVARSRREAVDEIRTTVIHEFGHYFGLSDDDMPE